MSDERVGLVFRKVRQRLGWRQEDVAQRAGTSRMTISRIERGHVATLSLETLRDVGRVLEIRLDILPRWRGGDLDRMLNIGHAAMHEQIAALFEALPGWTFAPEVSFSIYGERGIIDVLAWHAETRTLLVIELKTELVDVQEAMGTLHRKGRLAAQIGAERGWQPVHVATWLVLEDTRTNHRRLAAHRRTLRAALPADGRSVTGWLRNPVGPLAALSFLAVSAHGPRPGAAKRVRRPTAAATSSPGRRPPPAPGP